MKVSEIHDIAYHNLQKFRNITNVVTTISVLDYFVSRQYINLYNRNFINFALQDLGENILNFVDLVDTTHPDIPHVYQGIFDLSSDFSKRVLEYFEVAKLAKNENLSTVVPVLVNDLKKKYPKFRKYLRDVTQYIRLLKDPVVRANIRSLSSWEIEVKLSRPQIWPTLLPTFEPYLLSGKGEYYGFKRISMTNAAIILCKMVGCYKTVVRAKSPIVAGKLGGIIDSLDNCPAAGGRPIFDNFWSIEIDKQYVLLGEREKKCYFIICG